MVRMLGLFDGTPLERPVTCQGCEKPLDQRACPYGADGELLFPKDWKRSPKTEPEVHRK